jgi:hypothetical protein
MITRSEKTKNWASAFQSLAFIIAVMGGAVWSVYTFVLQERYISLDLSIDSLVLGNVSDDTFSITVDVIFASKGKRDVRIDIENSTMLIQRIETNRIGRVITVQDRVPIAYTRHDTQEKTGAILRTLHVQPNSTKRVSYYQPIKYCGTYFIHFSAPVQKTSFFESELDKSIAENDGGTSRSLKIWVASKYINISDPEKCLTNTSK